MIDDEAQFRQRINFLIIDGIAGSLITTLKPSEPLLLGPVFALYSDRIFDNFEVIRTGIIGELNALPLHELREHFSDMGAPTTDKWKAWASTLRAEIRAKQSNALDWCLLPFEPDRSLADFEFWSKAAFLTLDEALWLSVGLQPTDRFEARMRAREGQRKSEDPIAKFMVNRRELFIREFQAGTHSRRLSAVTLFEWINRVELEVHPGFRRMLEKMLKQASKASIPVEVTPLSTEQNQGKFEAREKASLSKLFVAIAIKEYGYDPEARRSPIPREIQDIAAQLGLDISQDTIRQYLQLGARRLPKGWKPDN